MAVGYWDGSIPTTEDSNSSTDDEYSPGQLIIDTVESSYEGSKSSTPTTPGKGTPTATTVGTPSGGTVLGENDFKGLTFVGKMDVLDPPDVICLYSYHWGSTHIDIITRNSNEPLVPITNVYGRIVPGLTRNAVSNRIPKLGAKTIALSEGQINVLKKLQLPITARNPPHNLSNFAQVTSHSNPVDILKTFNSQVVPTQSSSFPLPPAPPPHSSLSNSHSDVFKPLSPGKLNASLALTMGGKIGENKDTQHGKEIKSETKFLPLKNGLHLSVIFQENSYYILNAELQTILPQANQNVIGPLRSLLNINLEYASRSVMNTLKEAGVVGIKACRIIIYKVTDVTKMFNHWNIPVPQYITDLSNGKFPEGIVDSSLQEKPNSTTRGSTLSLPSSNNLPSSPKLTLNRIVHPVSSTTMSPFSLTSASLMSPSGVKVDLSSGSNNSTKTSKQRKNSYSSPIPLSDQDLEYNTLQWSEGKSITLLTPPSGESYVAIAELVDKVFSQRSQVSLQRRTRLGIATIPATSLQIHALRARGAIDPSSGYSKLIPLSGVISLAKEAALFIPPNILNECQKYIPPTDNKVVSNSPIKSASPHKRPPVGTPSLPPPPTLSLKDMSSIPISVKREVMNHPDVIVPENGFGTAEGFLYQVMWGKEKIVIFTSARHISYVGLYQIYDVLFKHLVTRMNFKMRMRKLGIKSIRAPSFIRQGLVQLDALPNSSPVCGLLRISEMERLVTSYDMRPPSVFYDLFLNERSIHEDSLPDEFKDFTTTTANEEKFIVSLPRKLLIKVPSLASSMQIHSRPVMASGTSGASKNSTALQNLAKKISQKNHRLAKSVSASGSVATRNCYSCGRSYPLTKKRCKHCGIFLVGQPCPQCNAVNYTQCTKCVQCGATLKGVEETSVEQNNVRTDILSEKFKNKDEETIEVKNENTEESISESSDEAESPSSLAPFSAPPIRTAVLKSMFPEQSKRGAGGVVTKTIFSGNITASRNCQECGALNSKKAKKCQQCRAPVQGRPCPQCARPNHCHSTECFKCGATLPFTATKWVLGGKVFRSTHDSGRLGMTNKQFRKAAENRAVITCIRCHRVRQYGRFKCGRCGDLYSATPIYNNTTTPPTNNNTNSKIKSQPQSNSNTEGLLQLAQNLFLLGIGEELLPKLSEIQEELRQLSYPAEEELEAAEEEYHKFTIEKSSKESLEVSLQVELDALILKIEKLDKQLELLKQEEINASSTMEVCPDQVKELETKLSAYVDLCDDDD